jgi:hypothetical protein
MSQNKNETLIIIIMATIAVAVAIATLVSGFIYSVIMCVVTMNQNKK